MTREQQAAHRARRLVRWYPASWRARYGEEFVALLVADLTERPHAPSRTLDVARSGLLARLSAAGLAGDALAPADRVRASLAAFACGCALFLAFGVSLWSQLEIGWQWSAPDAGAVAFAMQVMVSALVVLAGIAVVAAVPIAASAARALRRRDARRLVLPLVLLVAGGAVLVAGSLQFADGWPGTGGHPWPGRGIVPAEIASVAWASTLSITAYWMHPDKLGSFADAQIAWMAIAPLAMACAAAGAAMTIRRVELSARALRFETQAGAAAAAAMLVFLGGAACWMLEGDAGPRNLFPLGAIHLVDVAVMAGALVFALAMARRAGTRSSPVSG